MKYHSKKTEYDGIIFDSKKEAQRYAILREMERCGVIGDLRRQVRFVLIKGLRWSDGRKHRDTVYVADFTYIDNGKLVVEDVKGFKTPVYKIKKELMKAVHHIEIKEV